MKLIYLLISFALYSSIASALPLKVLQLNFNSEVAFEDSGYRIRDLRFNALTHWLKENSPDIIFLEEAWNYRDGKNIAVALAESAGYESAYRINMGFPGLFYDGDAVLAKAQFKLSEQRFLKLPHSAPELGNGQSWVFEFGAVSYAIGARLTQVSGKSLYIYSTHLLGSSSADRGDQSAAIVQDAKQWVESNGESWDSASVLIGGDFNSAPSEIGPQSIVQSGFLDSFAEVHPGDTSCTDCEIPDHAWFNPYTLAAGQLPSQAGFSDDLRDDYIFSRGFKPISSTILFTSPIGGVWMSDHYGLLSILGDGGDLPLSSLVHDSDPAPQPPTQILSITSDLFVCAVESDDDSSDFDCIKNLPSFEVLGARGVTVRNLSDSSLHFSVRGPGNIFANTSTRLNPGESASYSFDSVGAFTFDIENDVVDSDLQDAVRLNGNFTVQKSGY